MLHLKLYEILFQGKGTVTGQLLLEAIGFRSGVDSDVGSGAWSNTTVTGCPVQTGLLLRRKVLKSQPMGGSSLIGLLPPQAELHDTCHTAALTSNLSLMTARCCLPAFLGC